MDQNSNEELALKRAIWHFWSADWHKLRPWPEGTWIKLKPIIFYFLETRTRPSLYSDHLANFSNIQASINRDHISKFSTLFTLCDFPSF